MIRINKALVISFGTAGVCAIVCILLGGSAAIAIATAFVLGTSLFITAPFQ